MTATIPAPGEAPAHDAFPINGTDYIEFWCGNAKQSAHYYRAAWGHELVGYRGPETGVRDRASYLLVQDKLRFVLTSPLGPDGEIADHIRKHGDGQGEVVPAAIRTYGDTIHSIVERTNYHGLFLPGFVPVTSPYRPAGTGLKYVDHCVGNVELGRMNAWVKFYEDVLGFRQIIGFDDKDISTEYSALMSKVMANGNGRIKFPINEPALGRKKS